MREILNERIELSEAIEIAGKIVGSYPRRKVEDSYIGAIARVLCAYPASVARRAHVVPGGVPGEVSTLPSPAHVIKWCEDNAAPLRRSVVREERVKEQLVEREQVRGQTPRGMAMTTSWLDRSDPDAAQLSGQESRVKTNMRLRDEARAKLIAQVGQQAFDAIPDAVTP